MLLPDVENEPLSPRTKEVLNLLAGRQASPQRLRQPVAIIGPSSATPAQMTSAYRIANVLAAAGVTLICGGKGGVMEAASQGAYDTNGVVIGILPDNDMESANPYLTLGLPTGLGEARNTVIVSSALCLIAIGGGLGTISEIAFGLKLGKPVFAIQDAEHISGSLHFFREDDLIFEAAFWLCQHSRHMELCRLSKEKVS